MILKCKKADLIGQYSKLGWWITFTINNGPCYNKSVFFIKVPLADNWEKQHNERGRRIHMTSDRVKRLGGTIQFKSLC